MHDERLRDGERRRRGRRFFKKGDLKFLILELLQEQPRHGYDIIRALEDRFGGAHSPSPGAVYPTLGMLADLGLVVGSDQEGKRVFAPTSQGRDLLHAQSEVVEGIRTRMSEWWAPATREQLREIHCELKTLHCVVACEGGEAGSEALSHIRKIIVNARVEVEQVLVGVRR